MERLGLGDRSGHRTDTTTPPTPRSTRPTPRRLGLFRRQRPLLRGVGQQQGRRLRQLELVVPPGRPVPGGARAPVGLQPRGQHRGPRGLHLAASVRRRGGGRPHVSSSSPTTSRTSGSTTCWWSTPTSTRTSISTLPPGALARRLQPDQRGDGAAGHRRVGGPSPIGRMSCPARASSGWGDLRLLVSRRRRGRQGSRGASRPLRIAAPPAARRPDVLLVTIDTLRADATGFSGNRGGTTPVLDRLAARPRLHPAHAHNVVTLPSHASILTGLYPYQHGLRDNTGFRLRRLFPRSPRRSTGPAIPPAPSSPPIRSTPASGSTAALTSTTTASPAATRPRLLARRAAGRRGGGPGARLVAAQRGKPRFLWLHLYDPHAPYDPPEPFAPRFPANPYRRGGGRRRLPRAAPGPPARRGSRRPRGRHRRPRRSARRARRGDARPLRLRGDAPDPAGRLGPRRPPGATAARRGTSTSFRPCSPRGRGAPGGQAAAARAGRSSRAWRTSSTATSRPSRPPQPRLGALRGLLRGQGIHRPAAAGGLRAEGRPARRNRIDADRPPRAPPSEPLPANRRGRRPAARPRRGGSAPPQPRLHQRRRHERRAGLPAGGRPQAPGGARPESIEQVIDAYSRGRLAEAERPDARQRGGRGAADDAARPLAARPGRCSRTARTRRCG